MKRAVSLVFFIFMTLFVACFTYPWGAPNTADACTHIYPSGHYSSAQPRTPPLRIVLSCNYYQPNDTIDVTIESTDGEPWMGFILQARRVMYGVDQAQNMGSFVTNPSSTTQTCASYGGNTITHNSNTLRTSLTIPWIAPAYASGDIQFRATIVRNKTVYWQNVRSDILVDQSATRYCSVITTPASSNNTVTTQITTISDIIGGVMDVNLTSCGVTKSCYTDPAGCAAEQCNYIVSWSNQGDWVNFELSTRLASDHKWTALGFSHDLLMGDDTVVDCIMDSNRVVIQMSYNLDGQKSNTVLDDPQFGLVTSLSSGGYVDGKLICRFSRNITISPSAKAVAFATDAERVKDLDEPYYLLIPQGPSQGGYKNQHSIPVTTTPNAIDVTVECFSVTSGVAVYSPPLVKAHGIFMLMAWMLFASVGMLLPRYFKPAWPGKMWKNKPIWFQIHRACMIICATFTITGFVLILVETQGKYVKFSDEYWYLNFHPALGILVTALVIVNPVMAYFRCHPGEPKRWIFNIAHFSVGTVALVAAAITMFLGVYMPKANLPEASKWSMVAYLVWHFLVEMTLAVHMHYVKHINDIADSTKDKSTLYKKASSASIINRTDSDDSLGLSGKFKSITNDDQIIVQVLNGGSSASNSNGQTVNVDTTATHDNSSHNAKDSKAKEPLTGTDFKTVVLVVHLIVLEAITMSLIVPLITS